MERFTALSSEMKKKLCCFYSWYGNFAVLTLSKTVLIQGSANVISVNTFFSYSKRSKCPLPTFMSSFNLFLELRLASFTEAAENLPYLLQCNSEFRNRFSGFRLSFQKASCIDLQTDISRRFKSGELIGHCSFSIICGQFVSRQRTQCLQSPMHRT